MANLLNQTSHFGGIAIFPSGNALKACRADAASKYILSNKLSLQGGLHIMVGVIVTVCTLFFCSRYFFPVVDLDKNEFLNHHFKYAHWLITVWILGMQFIYFNIYFITEIMGIYSTNKRTTDEKPSKLDKIGSYILFSIVFPTSLMVSALFWTFYFLRREDIFPECVDIAFSPIFNHMGHTFPPALSVVYMMFTNKFEPPKNQTFVAMTSFLAAYAAGLIYVKLRSGKWIYTVLEPFSHFQVFCILGISYICAVFFFFIGYYINERMKSFRNNIVQITKLD